MYLVQVLVKPLCENKGKVKLHCLAPHFQHNFRLFYSHLENFRPSRNTFSSSICPELEIFQYFPISGKSAGLKITDLRWKCDWIHCRGEITARQTNKSRSIVKTALDKMDIKAGKGV